MSKDNSQVLVVSVKGTTYQSAKDLAAEYGRTPQWVSNILAEIKECGRYRSAWIYLGEKDKLINTLVFEDYLFYRSKLKDRNLAKKVPPYDPAEVRRQRGEYKEVIHL